MKINSQYLIPQTTVMHLGAEADVLLVTSEVPGGNVENIPTDEVIGL